MGLKRPCGQFSPQLPKTSQQRITVHTFLFLILFFSINIIKRQQERKHKHQNLHFPSREPTVLFFPRLLERSDIPWGNTRCIDVHNRKGRKFSNHVTSHCALISLNCNFRYEILSTIFNDFERDKNFIHLCKLFG